MQINELIGILKDYVKKSDQSDNKEIFDSYQTKYLDGYGGVIINSFDNKFEIYAYIKNKELIASPLLYWKTDKAESAVKYYNILVNIIDSQDYNVLKGFCISGL
jgi:cellobiose-specific phosphotransferase system component IIB